jgi:multidrug efflux pump subunit AcrB
VLIKAAITGGESMGSIIRFSMRNTVALCLMIVMLIGGGIYSVMNMNIEKYPNVDIPYLTVFIPYPGASPEQAMKDIGEPLEKEVMNIDGVENVYTDSTPWGVSLTAEYDMSVDMDKGEESMRQAVDKIKLPEGAEEPEIFRQTPDNPVIYSAGIYGTGKDEELQTFVKNEIVPALEGIDGVDKVETSGLEDKKVYVRLKPERLKEYGLTVDHVKQMIMANNLSIPIGDLTINDEILPVRVNKELTSLDGVKHIRILLPKPKVPTKPGEMPITSVQLGDLAEVAFESEDKSYTRINGKEAVTFGLVPESGANTVAIVNEAKDKLKDIELPEGYKVEELLDQSTTIKESVYAMLREAILGAVMAVVVTLLFLRNVRSTLIAIISIPLSIFTSFLVLHFFFGYTLNIMTLSGIAVAVGRVVDDSIVVIENIFRRIRASKERSNELVEQSTKEVASAITSSTITTVAVFLPMAFVPGIVGRFFTPLAWTIVISLLFSLLVAITVVPLFSRIFLLKLEPEEHKENRLQHVYRKTLSWALSHRWVTLGIAFALLVSSVLLIAPKLGTTFLPQETSRSYDIHVSMEQGTSAERTNEIASEIEGILIDKEEIEQISTSVGEEGAEVSFAVKESIDHVDSLIKEIRDELADVSGAKDITMSGVGDLTGGATSQLQIIVNGPNIKKIEEASEQMADALKDIDGLADIKTTLQGEKPEIKINLNDEKLAEHQLLPATVAQSLRSYIAGDVVTKMVMNDTTTDLLLSVKVDDVDSLEALGEQTVTNMLGQPVALKEVGTLERVKNRVSVNHLNGKEYVLVQATITESNTGEISKKADEALNKLDLPSGVSWYKEGASAAMEEGFRNMTIAIAVGILLVYLVMVIAFGEGRAPFVILFAIPFSVIGSLAGLWTVHEPIGMPAMIGLLMLNGIVVTNAIVLIDRVKQNEKRGMEKHQALLEAGVVRLRPILMTAIATVGALLPMAFSSHAGLVSQSLAVVVIGGLTTSTLLTLIIVPILYSLLHSTKKNELVLERTGND